MDVFDPSPVVENEALLAAHLKAHPEFRLAAVCSCGWVGPAESIGGHVGGSNRRWTIRAKTKRGKRFQEPHSVKGYTLMEAD